MTTDANPSQPVLPAPVAAYWNEACARLGIDPASRVDVTMFGTPDMADELAALVCIGQKRGTAGLIDRGVVAVFEKWGFTWGGTWHYTDPMHFEVNTLRTPAPESAKKK